MSKTEGQISDFEKDYNEFKLQYNKQSAEEFLIQRAAKTTIQLLYDKVLFDSFSNTDEILKDFLFLSRRRPDLSEQVNDDVQ